MKDGFSDAVLNLKTVVNANEKVTIDAMKEAADYFVAKLSPMLIRSDLNKKHMADGLKVVVKKDVVQVIFEDYAWYWYLKEHGHKKANGRGRVPGTHIIRNTTENESNRLQQMILSKL